MIYQTLQSYKICGKKALAVLIDPDKAKEEHLEKILQITQTHTPDFFLIGGSLLSEDYFEECISFLKKNSDIPLVIFPGDNRQISKQADALLLLSVISSRNAELLIGQHVQAALRLKTAGIEVIPVGYMLFDGGKLTSVQYLTNSLPLPNDKTDLALATALAGELLGLKLLYLEAGSGAKNTVNPLIIKKISQNISLPIFVGGGIRTKEEAEYTFRAGADTLVVGTKIEENSPFLREICRIRDEINA
jgi:putative glycerol-1-phosphate prenyltransferase